MSMSQKPTTVEEYIVQAPETTQKRLREMRACLQKAAPDARELLKWGKPAFEAEYILFVYAGSKNHLSLHPTVEVVTAFQDELEDYETLQNTVKFPLDAPLPLKLITRMAELRVQQSKSGVKWK